jgi:hypothetical protein
MSHFKVLCRESLENKLRNLEHSAPGFHTNPKSGELTRTRNCPDERMTTTGGRDGEREG